MHTRRLREAVTGGNTLTERVIVIPGANLAGKVLTAQPLLIGSDR